MFSINEFSFLLNCFIRLLFFKFENSDKLFEVAYKIAEDNGAENPYEVASEIATGIK